jgi:prefoldin alpha subunit
MAETIDVSKLPIQQLDQLQKQLANEVNVLQESLGRLKQVQGSFMNSETSLEQLKSLEERKQILVPLTGSLYVPGTLVNNNQVLVDIGTGYYIGKSVDDAKKYFEKKIEFLSKQLEQLSPILQQKNMMRENVVDILQQKYAIQMQVQKAAAVQAK